jgi:crotonobetainyl-CoA:carnitine CoA-transferase CaiB-like acyl-CoA transferase
VHADPRRDDDGPRYEALRAANPRLIHSAISGYDARGPEAARPGYDLLVQGEAGLMAMNGEADQPPLKFGVAVVDLMTGMYAAQAVLFTTE